MLRIGVAVMVLLLAGSLAAPQALADAPVLILGDSLSAGYGISRDASWPSLLAGRLEREGYRQSVVNASISGETTAGGSRRLAPLLEEHSPALVVIALGTNDGLRGVDVTETRRNLLTMIRVAQAAEVAVVLVKVRIPPNFGPRYTESFEGMFDEVAESDGVSYAPFMLERFAARMSAFQADGLHPTAAVQPDILETLWPSIRQALDAAAVEYE